MGFIYFCELLEQEINEDINFIIDFLFFSVKFTFENKIKEIIKNFIVLMKMSVL